MKKIMILGTKGMFGHTCSNYLNSLNKYDIVAVARDKADWNIDIEFDLDVLLEGILRFTPDIIINCIGLLVKASEERPDRAIYINSYFPHWLAQITKNTPTKIIHLSTDCVFDGSLGSYMETHPTNEKNWYGRTKVMGELNNNKDLTLRLSIIGDELKTNGAGLFEWFMRQKGDIKGFSSCFWNGVTCLELAKQIDKIINLPHQLTGLYHLAPPFNISKYHLLCLINIIFNKDINIFPDSTFVQNKTLYNSRYDEYQPNIPYYRVQLEEMKEWIEKHA